MSILVTNSRLEKLLSDNSVVGLFISNLITIVMAVVQGWSLTEVLWVYWAQSVIIGWFNFWRMLGLKEFSTQDLKMNGQRVKPTDKTRRQVSFFFLLHYGLFHLAYLFAIVGMHSEEESSLLRPGLLLMIAVFFANHLYSYYFNQKRTQDCLPNIGSMMFLPYARIIPMHLTMFLGAAAANNIIAMVIFLSLKTLADVIMHVVEHAKCRGTSIGK